MRQPVFTALSPSYPREGISDVLTRSLIIPVRVVYYSDIDRHSSKFRVQTVGANIIVHDSGTMRASTVTYRKLTGAADWATVRKNALDLNRNAKGGRFTHGVRSQIWGFK